MLAYLSYSGLIMAYNSKSIANYFLDLAEKENDHSMTPMKIQKLVYYAQGWHLAVYGRPLIHEQIEAWQYGPVIESLYRTFKFYGKEPVEAKAVRYKFPTNIDEDSFDEIESYVATIYNDENDVEDPEVTADFLEEIWRVYGGFSGIQLSNMTHTSGSPWDVVAKEYDGDPPKGTDIPQQLIKDYFEEMSAKSEEAQSEPAH